MSKSEEKAITGAILSVAAATVLLSAVFTIAWDQAGHYHSRISELEAKVKALEKLK